MATAKYSTPTALSSNLVTTELNSISNTNETATFTYDNSTNKDLYASVTVLLGSITSTSGASLTLRVTMSDGTNTADKIGGDIYVQSVLVSTSAKVVIFPFIRLYPFSLRFSIVNNTGATLASSNNGVYIRPYNEDIA